MMDGSLPEFNNPKIAFSLNVSYYRRKRILDSIWSKDPEKKKKGKKVRDAFDSWLKMDKRLKMFAKGEDPDDISFDDLQNDESGANTRTGFPAYKRVIKND